MTPASPDSAVTAYIGVGSNIDPEHYVARALAELSAVVEVTGVSTLYQTQPLERPEQADYRNGVWAVRTRRTHRALKGLLQSIESRLGRRRGADPYASRPIDLDLLLYGEAVVNEPGLRLPDPDLYGRAFVARPLLELAPTLVLPDTGIPLARVVEGMDPRGMVPCVEHTRSLRQLLSASESTR